MGLNLKSLGRKITDIFDANSAQDRQKRVAQGQPALYADQQRAQGNMRPNQNFGSAVIGNTARFLNTGEQAKQEVLDTARLYGAQLRGDKTDWANTNQRIQQRQQKAYQPNSGFLGAGTIFNNPQEFNSLGAKDIAKRVGATTVGTAGEVLPMGKGLRAGIAGKEALRTLAPKLAVYGAGTNVLADAGSQYISTGKIDPMQSAKAAVTGAVLGVAPTVVGRGARVVAKTPLNETGAVGKNVGKTPFQNKTEIDQINRILENKDTVGTGQKIADYYRTAKGEDWQVVKMSPDEYLDRAAKAMGQDPITWKTKPMGNVDKYAQDMTKGDKFPMPWMNEVAGSQEGRTRALAAKKIGMKEIDVAVATKPKPTKPKVTLKEQPKTNVVKSKVDLKLKPGEKIRGFEKNITKTLPENPVARVVSELMPGYKPITNKKTLTKAADAIASNPQAEFARVITKPQLTSAQDVATGNLLLRQAIESGDAETAIQLGTKMGIDGTKLGQAVQAYATFKKTTPEGIVTYASKRAGRVGRELDPIATKKMIEEAQRVAAMPEGFDKAQATRALLSDADKVGRTWKDTVGEILSTPRAALATADFSAPLRQGAVLGSRFPKQFKQSFTESAKYMFNPKYYAKEMYDLTQRPTYSLMKSRGLAVSGAEDLTGVEEQFLANILESKLAKKAGIGQVVAGSNRAYTGFLTKLRADVFDKVLVDSKTAGVKLGNKELDSLAKFINSASGRGDGNITNLVSKAQVLFSPKLWKSRIDTLNPGYYARLDPVARKYALESAASFAGIATTILGLAKVAGADVENDPRSADFGKIKVGNTRYDILGGHQQNIRLAAQLYTGEKINSETGELQTLGPDRGFGKPSRLDILYQFVENKENPVIGFGSKMLRGTDPTGKPLNRATEFGNLFVPLNIHSAYETAKDQGSLVKGAAMNLPGTFGVGVQTYGKAKSKDQPSTPAPAKPNTKDPSKPDYITPTEARRDKYSSKLNKDISDESRKTLVKYRSLSSFGRAKFNANPDNEVALALAKLEEGVLSNSLTESQRKSLERKIYGSTTRRTGRRSGGSKRSTGSIYKYAVSPNAGGATVRPKVTVRGRAKVAKKRKVAMPKVTIKKSKV